MHPEIERFLRTGEVCRRTGVTRQTIWKWCRAGHFPPSRRIGPGDGNTSVAWLESEVTEWMKAREVAVGPDTGYVDGTER